MNHPDSFPSHEKDAVSANTLSSLSTTQEDFKRQILDHLVNQHTFASLATSRRKMIRCDVPDFGLLGIKDEENNKFYFTPSLKDEEEKK